MCQILSVIIYFLYLSISTTSTITTIQSNDFYSCNRTWPQMELFIPITLVDNGTRNNEWVDVFLRGFLLFWPVEISGTTIRLMLDEEVVVLLFISQTTQI